MRPILCTVSVSSAIVTTPAVEILPTVPILNDCNVNPPADVLANRLAAAPGLLLDVMAWLWSLRAKLVAAPSLLVVLTVRLALGAAATMACVWSLRAGFALVPAAALASGVIVLIVGVPQSALSVTVLVNAPPPVKPEPAVTDLFSWSAFKPVTVCPCALDPSAKGACALPGLKLCCAVMVRAVLIWTYCVWLSPVVRPVKALWACVWPS